MYVKGLYKICIRSWDFPVRRFGVTKDLPDAVKIYILVYGVKVLNRFKTAAVNGAGAMDRQGLLVAFGAVPLVSSKTKIRV